MINQEAFDRFSRRPLMWFLTTVVILCAFLVAQFTTVDHRSASQTEFFGVIDNLLIGILVSFVFYFLVVHLPEKQRRNRLRRNFLKFYLSLKEGLIWEIIFSSQSAGRRDLNATQEQVDLLMDVKAFRNCFSGGRESHEGWYAFMNHMTQDSPQFRDIVLLLSQLRMQVEYILLQDVFESLELMNFFSWLRDHLLRLERTDAADWEKSPLIGFLYQLLSGWDPVSGYRDFDYIESEASKII